MGPGSRAFSASTVIPPTSTWNATAQTTFVSVQLPMTPARPWCDIPVSFGVTNTPTDGNSTLQNLRRLNVLCFYRYVIPMLLTPLCIPSRQIILHHTQIINKYNRNFIKNRVFVSVFLRLVQIIKKYPWNFIKNRVFVSVFLEQVQMIKKYRRNFIKHRVFVSVFLRLVQIIKKYPWNFIKNRVFVSVFLEQVQMIKKYRRNFIKHRVFVSVF